MSKAEPKPPPFHNPFAAAKDQLAALVKQPALTSRPAPAVARPSTAPKPKPPEVTDDRLFEDQMQGVVQLGADPRGRVQKNPGDAIAPTRPTSRAAEDEAEAYASLADLVAGGGPFDFSLSDEFIEGLSPGLDRRILKRLRKGDYSMQGHVDLHGLTREAAHLAVERFVAESRSAGKRAILIVHGRGLNSKDQIPVLKERLKAWLERGRIARSVLAFCTARPCDGGAGAVYVLLRR